MSAADRAVMDGLFSDAGRADPAAVLASAGIPGCRYAFVDDDVMFRVIGRFVSRLPPDRHRAIRSRFSGLFTPRRVETYRETTTHRIATLIDALPERLERFTATAPGMRRAARNPPGPSQPCGSHNEATPQAQSDDFPAGGRSYGQARDHA